MSPLRALCAIAVPVVLFVGCSSDGDSTSEPAGTDPASTATSVDVGSTVDPDATGTEAFCAAGADLRANVESLADVDVLTGGLSGIEDTLASIGDNLAAMRDSGADVATAEIEQLQAAVDDLQSAVADLGGNLSVTAAGNVATSISELGSAGGEVLSAYTAACE